MGEDGEIILVSGDKVSGPWNKSGAPPAPTTPGEDHMQCISLFVSPALSLSLSLSLCFSVPFFPPTKFLKSFLSL